MNLLQRRGRFAEASPVLKAKRDALRRITRLPQRALWPVQRQPCVSYPCRHVISCITRIAAPDTVAPAAALPAPTDPGLARASPSAEAVPATAIAPSDSPATTLAEAAPTDQPPEAAAISPGPAQPAMTADVPRDSADAEAAAESEASSSGSSTSWPGRRHNSGPGRGGGSEGPQPYTPRAPPPYAEALTSLYIWPRPRPYPRERPSFLDEYPVPAGKTFNVNSFLGKRDPHGGQYLVPERRYRQFLESYAAALDEGYPMFLTENYHQRVYKFFLEFDWDWDTDLALVMEVTPQLVALATEIASEFYSLPYANVITSIRTPYKVHLNFPQLLTTELLACLCRERLLEACAERLGPQYGGRVDWERLIDFPHGSLRLLGSRKATHMDSDPAWVREKFYHPARLTADGRWQPGRITAALLAAASIFPQRHQVAAFERSPAYLDMIYSDLEAYQKKMEERRLERARRRAEREREQLQQQPLGGSSLGSGPREQLIPNLPPGSSKNPLYVRLEVQPDETVVIKVHIKSKYRFKNQRSFFSSGGSGEATQEGGRLVPQPTTDAAAATVAEEATQNGTTTPAPMEGASAAATAAAADRTPPVVTAPDGSSLGPAAACSDA